MPEPPPIVVLEDDRAVALTIRRALEAARLANPIVVFGHGDDARDYLLRGEADRSIAPVLVLLDVHVPGCSGLEILELMRAQPRLASVPVVMLSGSGDETEIERAYDSGATAYLVKPAGIHGLRDMLGDIGLRILLLPGAP